MKTLSTPAHLLDSDRLELERRLEHWLQERAEPHYRLHQVLSHLFRGGNGDPHTMGNLPSALRKELARELLPPPLTLERVQISADGSRKYHFLLGDGVAIEAVAIPSADRHTLCISSQAGCPAACTFCATGAGGFRRNLSPAEILGQWLAVCQELGRTSRGGVTQIVFMGMGEPLYNYPALATSLRTLTDRRGFAFSPRRITVSTVGIAPKITQLAREFPQVRLALSLHSARNETRTRIVPVNRRYPVEVLQKTLRSLRDQLRRISLEYVLLEAVNDTPREALALARFARDTAGHINLIPFHPFPGATFPPTHPEKLCAFHRLLKQNYGGRVTIRKSCGLDIDGACGQLALIRQNRSSSDLRREF